jgi:hypothetical protein
VLAEEGRQDPSPATDVQKSTGFGNPLEDGPHTEKTKSRDEVLE